jgi:predicted amidophosphoribosyltransferase
LLWQYKGTLAHPAQPWAGTATASLLFEFLQCHLACIEGRWGPRDVVTVVPSHTSVERGFDHLKTMTERVPALTGLCHWDLNLLERTATTKIPKRTISDTAYRVNARAESVAGRRVLLIDDTFTSGATLFSAATALRQAGADDVVALPIGRQLATEWPDGRAILADHISREFDIARCVLGCP